MSIINEKAEKRALDRLNRFDRESRMLNKRSEDYQVFEEVFDKPTLMTLYNLINNHVFRYLNGIIKSGKESRVYWGVKDDGTNVAVKIFLTVAKEFRKRNQYVLNDPRFTRLKKGTLNMIELWARKEYKNLDVAYFAGIRVPRPHHVKRNVLVMDFIGQNGIPASLLREVNVTQYDYERILIIIKKLYVKARLVHADLSEYNIFKNNKKLVLFDFGSAVDISHPSSRSFLIRDIKNINHFFYKRGIKVNSGEDVLRSVMIP